MSIKSFFLLLLLFNGFCAIAQVFDKDYKFVSYTTNDGLSDVAVNKTAYDRHGFLWVATKNGLNKFDGRNFKKYSPVPGDSNSLRSIWITDLLLDQNGLLWISTEWGICWYDEKFDRFHYLNDKNIIQVVYKGPLCTGAGNSIWIAAEDGLKQIDLATKKITASTIMRLPDPQCIVQVESGLVFIGTRGHGLYVYDTVSRKSQADLQLPVPADAHIMGFYKGRNGSLFAATSEGMLRIDRAKNAKLYSSGTGALTGQVLEQLMCIAEYPSFLGAGKLLCGTYNNQLLIFDTVANVFTERLKNAGADLNGYPAGVFNDLFCDNNICWIATDHGLTKLNLAVQDIVSHRIPAFYNANKRILLKQLVAGKPGTAEIWISLGKGVGGIMRYNTSTGAMILLKTRSLLHPAVSVMYNSIVLDSMGNLWGFANGQIDQYNLATGSLVKSIPVAASVLSATLDAQQNFWIGTASGLGYFNRINAKLDLYNYSFSGTPVENTSFPEPFPVVDLKLDRLGNIWLTSKKFGLFYFNTSNRKFTPYRQPFNTPYESRNRCVAVFIDGNGKVWHATMAGLSCFNPQTSNFTNYNTSHGLQSTYIYAIQSIEGQHIWGRGNTGVFCFDTQTSHFANFNLPQDHYGAFNDQSLSVVNGKLILGFEGGYSNFYTSELPVKSTGNVFITSCRVMDQTFYFDPPGSTPIPAFSSRENTFRFDFTTIDYNQVAPNQLLYTLEGFDKKWLNAGGQNFVQYTNLPSGKYQFKVRLASGAQISNDAVASFLFTIRKPYWKTPLFIASMMSMLALVLYVLYKYRVAQLKKAYLIRSNISRNLHDEIGATLSSINIYSDVARKKDNIDETRGLIDKIYNASAKAMESMNDIVWYVNPNNDILENILVRMREYAVPLLEAKNIVFSFEVITPMDTVKLNMQQRQHFYLVFKEAINNILKYSNAGNVNIHFDKKGKLVSMEVRDDGLGFNIQAITHGNGIKNMQSRARELNGNLLINSSPGKGTVIRLVANIT